MSRAIQNMELRLSNLRDRQADVKRAIDVWESIGFDATEGHEKYAELAWEIGECLVKLDELYNIHN